ARAPLVSTSRGATRLCASSLAAPLVQKRRDPSQGCIPVDGDLVDTPSLDVIHEALLGWQVATEPGFPSLRILEAGIGASGDGPRRRRRKPAAVPFRPESMVGMLERHRPVTAHVALHQRIAP